MWDSLIFLLCAVCGYLIGSLNAGILVSHIVNHSDIRESGSGNAGFTNVKRVYGAKSAAIVCVIDVVKTIVACLGGGLLIHYFTAGTYTAGALLCGLCAQLGHIFPVYFGFKGGKGFICGMTTILMSDWRIFILALAMLFAVTLITKYVSLGSLCATLSYVVLFVIFYFNDIGIYCLAATLGLVVFISHRQNIKRLIAGTENKTYFFGKEKKRNKK